MTQLFFIKFVGEGDIDSDNLDLMVEATSVEEAITLWRAYYELEAGEAPQRVFSVPALTGVPRALRWHDADGLEQVYRHDDEDEDEDEEEDEDDEN
jgi:hypothetical protein